MRAITEGRSGLKEWFGRIGRWRVGIQWCIVALFLPAADFCSLPEGYRVAASSK